MKKLICLMLTVFLVLSIPAQAKANVLTKRGGVNYFGQQKETWYNLPMQRVLNRAHKVFWTDDSVYWIDDRGVKRFGSFIIVAADYSVHPYGSLVETSLGTGIVLDSGKFTETNKLQVDIAVNW